MRYIYFFSLQQCVKSPALAWRSDVAYWRQLSLTETLRGRRARRTATRGKTCGKSWRHSKTIASHQRPDHPARRTWPPLSSTFR